MSLKLQQILATPMVRTERGDTIRDFLVSLLLQLWQDKDGFSGKYPFGDSMWEWEVYSSLVAAGHTSGTLNEQGYIDEDSDFDPDYADFLILKAIEVL